MEAFVYNVEECVLSADEMRDYAHIVHYLTYLQNQHRISQILGAAYRPLRNAEWEEVEVRVRHMWRVELSGVS